MKKLFFLLYFNFIKVLQCPNQWFSNLNVHENHMEGFLKHR